jgi:hypothetical protein
VTSLLKRATASDVFTEMRHYQWRVCLLQIPTAQIDTCACIFYSDKNSFLGKHAIVSGTFTEKTPLEVTLFSKDAIRNDTF